MWNTEKYIKDAMRPKTFSLFQQKYNEIGIV